MSSALDISESVTANQSMQTDETLRIILRSFEHLKKKSRIVISSIGPVAHRTSTPLFSKLRTHNELIHSSLGSFLHVLDPRYSNDMILDSHMLHSTVLLEVTSPKLADNVKYALQSLFENLLDGHYLCRAPEDEVTHDLRLTSIDDNV